MTVPSRQDLPARPPTPAGDLDALREEFANQGVGPLVVREVEAIAFSLVPRYNAAIYSQIGNWRHGFADLVQDVVADSLLRDHQADFMFAAAGTIDDFRRLLGRQVRRCLARHRTRTVIDNLLDRARPVLAAPPYEQGRRHLNVTYSVVGEVVENRAATFQELRLAARTIRSVPQQRSTSRDRRAPMVYTAAHLREVLRRVAAALPVAFTLGELDRVLRLALPHFLPSVLDQSVSLPRDPAEGVSREVILTCADELLCRLVPPLDMVLAMKIAGASDADIARILRVCRRTATYRKAAAYLIVEEVLGPLGDATRVAVLDESAAAMRLAIPTLPPTDGSYG